MSKQGKSGKSLIVGIVAAVVVLAALLVVLLTQCTGQQAAEPTTQATEPSVAIENADLYWNVDRALYDGKSEAGMSSRKIGSDGYYHVRFFKDGKIVELKVIDKLVVNNIEVRDLMGLVFDENGIVVDAVPIEEMPVQKTAWKFYVQSVGGKVVKVNSSDKFNGMEVILEIKNGAKIYDMTGVDGEIGMEAMAAINDRIMAVSDMNGNLLAVYIYDRSNRLVTFEAECQHCEKVVEWQEWKDAKTLPKTIGHYQLVTDVKLSAQQSMQADAKICLDLNGHRVDGADGKRIYSVHNLNGELAIMDTSEEKKGTMAAHGESNTQGLILFIRYGACYLYDGILDASDASTTHSNGATCVYVAANRFFYMNGGELIGGTAKYRFNEETGKYVAGMGGTVYNKGKFVLNDGVIRDGRAVSIAVRSNGKVTYQRGIGGNIVSSTGSVLEINGGVIKNGRAGTGGNIFLDGTAEFIMNGGTISGGRAVDPARNGGNLFINSKATAVMNGGLITGGSSKNLSGNVHLVGSFTMNGGTISNGKCLDAQTGKVKPTMTSFNMYVSNGARFSMYGGTITGGVAAVDSSTTDGKTTRVVLSGYATITGAPEGSTNLSLLPGAEKVRVTVGTLRDRAKINVTTSGVFSLKTKEENRDNFYSDVEGADILYVDECLALGKLACLCGSETHFGECDGTQLVWGPWTSATSLPNAEGNYYLVTDVARTANASFGSTTNQPVISIDLNGHTVDCKQRMGTSYTEINIVDHAGGGIILGGGPNGGKDHTGVLLMAGNAVTNVYGGTIALRADHNTCDTGGVFGVAGGATLNIYGGVIDGSNAAGERTETITHEPAEGEEEGVTETVTVATVVNYGGAIRVTGTLNMTGGTVIGGEVTAKGGAIYMNSNGAVLNLSGGTIQGGTAIQGGNIYADLEGKVNITGATVTGGSTKVNASNATTDSNGGNIYVNKEATLNLSAGAVEKGFSVNGGGNVYVSGKLNMSGGKIVGGDSSNNAQRFSKNIMVVNGTVTLSGGEIDGYVAMVTNGTPGASLTVSGKPVLAGGEYNLRLVSANTEKYPRPVVTVNGVLEEGAKIVVNETGVISGVTVEENVKAFECTDPFNTAILTEEKCVALGYVHCLCGKDTHESWCDGKDLLWEPYSGGGLYNSGNFYLNKDVIGGGQISVGSNGKDCTINLDLFGHTYEGSTRAALVYSKLNIVDSVGGGKLSGKGPATNHSGTLLMAKGAEVNLYQGTITVESDHNVMSHGGVVGVGGGSTLNVWPDGTIDGSNAVITDQHAGAVRLTGVLNLKGGTIIGGTAKIGGAIAIENGGVLNMTSGTITGGKAPNGSGGNIAMYAGSTANITGGTVSGGEALNIGGNIWLIKPDADVSGGTLTVGGDAKILGGKTTAGSGNHGGSIHVEKGTVMVLKDQAEVSGGVSAGGGGNIYVSGTLTIRDNAVVKGGKANGGGQSYGHNILVNSGTLNLEGGVVEGYISAVNVSDPVNCFINISGSPEVNKGTSNLRLTYASGATEYPVVAITGPISGENKIGIRLETKPNYTIDGVANTGLFVKNADGATADGEKFFYADAPSTGKIVLMEDGLNVHGEGYRVACACGGRLEGSAYHTCKKVTWKPWKTTDKLPSEGNYYLSTNVALATHFGLVGVQADCELGIDLNGHTVSASGDRILSLYDGNVTDNTYNFVLNITDNGNGKGKLVPSTTYSAQGAAIWITEKTQTVNIFGGTVDGSGSTLTSKNPGGVISVGRGTLNIYDGTVVGCTYKNTEGDSIGAAIGVTYNHNGGTLNLYGGSVVGGSADLGEAIYVDKSTGKFNAYGGTVTGSVYNLGTMTVGGTAQLEEVQLADGVKLTVADDFDAAKASVGIKMAAPGVFAENVATDLSAAFASLDTGYVVKYTTDKTLELEAKHVHCWCYGADVKPEGHVCEDDVVWEAIDSSAANPFIAEDGGHYHLNWTNNVAKKFSVPSNATVYLCLAGSSMRAANVIDLGENSKIVICDCKGTGVLTTTANSPLIADQNATILLMSGTVNGTYGTTASRVTVVVPTGGTFEMYGGKLTGGCAALDSVTDTSKKEGTDRGGNLTVHGTAKLMGGSITGGKYNGKDRDVTAYADGSVTVGGKVNIGVLFIPNNGVVNVVEKDLDAAIGVAMQTPTANITNVSSDVSSSFTSAQAGYDTVGWKNGALVLGVKADHQHCFCENAEALPAGHKCDTLIAWTAVEKSAGSNVYLEDGGHYYLNWTGSSAQVINVPNDVEAYLCLNGATIYATQAIKLNSNSVLHICDCSAGKTGTVTVSGASETAPIYMNSGVRTVNLYSGRILGSANGTKLVSVNLSGGTPTFNMYGGTISGGNNTSGNGGNVQVTGANGKFNMYGGTITGGQVVDGKHGGNVFMSKGQFVMNGGTITGGKTTGGKGGNVVLLPNGATATFTMNGGVIENGSAANGGNIALNALGTEGDATFTMNGGTVKGGTATTAGENLFLYSAKDTVIVNAGSIIGGTIANAGGGNITVGAGATVDGLN